QATAVGTADAAIAWLRASSDAAATHNCWAWRIGEDYRSSDDGEPAGTAGRPILAAIDGQGFDRVAVVVTRWYGGIKLGAGGLMRAYGGAAAECLRAAPKLPIVALTQAIIAFDFEHTGVVHAVLAAHGAEKLSEQFATQGVRLRIRVPESALPALRAQLRDATRGRVALSS
ncbi:MAG TPA: YigZ family protein, partial [Xanthomonadaceae bacterium]|nr:YigZ family protein [Xanthomonadaceae bacterium]